LGIDVGRSRVRIAQITQEAQGPTLRFSIALDLAPDNDLTTTVREALEQSGISERRCVVSLGEPDAMLVPLALPSMSLLERQRTARFEASRVIDYPIDEARIHLKMLNRTRGLHVLGIVRERALSQRISGLRAAGLRPIAIDHESLAFGRAFPNTEAVLDVGSGGARLHAYGREVPISARLSFSGSHVTEAIANSFSIDLASAERRKRTHGSAGAADVELDALGQTVGNALIAARSRGIGEIQRITLVGNGARLVELVKCVERHTGCIVTPATKLDVLSSAYPDDVMRASVMDRALAIGLALWSCAGERT
jgi:Tfp pilus assembly PilM family ATPase